MSNFKHAMAIVPMLSILSVSPMLIDTPHASRDLASSDTLYSDPYGVCEDVDACEEGNSYYEEMIQDQKSTDQKVQEIVTQKQEEKVQEIVVQKKEEKEKRKALQKAEVKEDKKEEQVVAEQKAEVKEDKKEEQVVAEQKAEVKEDNKEEQIVAKQKAEVKEDKKEEEEEEKEVCEHEKKEVLTSEAKKLNEDQNLILQQMLMMNQMMLSMFQQQQIFQMQQHLQYQGPVNQQAYQYAPQQTAGNWVYYPNGFNPNGMYPSQLNQPQYQTQAPQNVPNGYNNWGSAQQNYFQNDPRMSPMQVNPGTFGQPALGYNMGITSPTVQPPYASSMI